MDYLYDSEVAGIRRFLRLIVLRGGTFWKTNAYAPYPVWLWLNGHGWTKRQLEKARVGYEALDNGFREAAESL